MCLVMASCFSCTFCLAVHSQHGCPLLATSDPSQTMPTGAVPRCTDPSMMPSYAQEIGFTVLGLLTFIPGFFHCRIAYYTWKGYPGYTWDKIPAWT